METADTEVVDRRVRILKELVSDSLYVVDERAVAGAILARAAVHRTVAAPQLRGEETPRPIRSFRRTRSARSFRLTNGPAAERHHHD